MLNIFITGLSLILLGPLLYMIWMHTARRNEDSADVLIVLGYRCDRGEIHPLLKERLDTAIRLYRKKTYRAIIVSGGAVTWDRSEAEIMRDYLLAQHIPPEAVLIEDWSRNTVHNVVNCRVLMERHGYKSCVLISNSFHIRRMKYIMRRLGIPAGFYYSRRLSSIVKDQLKLTFQEVRAFRLTLPWLDRAKITAPGEMMGR
ncbi:YdcF family protein [Paenibacillus lemnae]|uniref:YdcF family protein n=1 Tax=Paenibacillus lemnae TaxID=1330551 RepID=A0A848M0I3_PAELE|nr:YdcF family protein [Paenibacillus lemnae]NMO94418.1 YdcF family protein [Paenibacillus lemnae]